MLQQAVVIPLLTSVQTRSGADGVYLHRFEGDGQTARLAAWTGMAPGKQPGLLQGAASREHFERDSPIVLHEDAWSDRRFAGFPEFAAQLFQGLVSVPLIYGGRNAGMLNVCRVRPASLPAGEVALLFGLSVPAGALLAADSENEALRQEIQKLSQQLADRKIIDRAKGLLQANFAWTEEQAYLHLRRVSRQTRRAMREIATDVIERGNLHLVEARHAS